jgi:hypothetical protein
MINAQSTKFVQLTPPQSDGSGGVTVAELDTLGYDYCTILVDIGASAGCSACKVTESDTAGSGHADVTADFNGTTATVGYGETSTLNIDGTSAVAISADDNKLYTFELDLTKRKRFLDMTITVAGTCLIGVVAILERKSNGGVNSDSLSERGLEGAIRA